MLDLPDRLGNARAAEHASRPPVRCGPGDEEGEEETPIGDPDDDEGYADDDDEDDDDDEEPMQV